MDENQDSRFFRTLGDRTEWSEGDGAKASPRLKSRVYSALIECMEESGSLLDLTATRETDGLCVFERLVEITPMSETVSSFNACSVCHARVLAERLRKAPIYWGGCPYVGFQGR